MALVTFGYLDLSNGFSNDGECVCVTVVAVGWAWVWGGVQAVGRAAALQPWHM